jgi:hypothetical protein
VIGWLPRSVIDGWRQGRVECLEQAAQVRPGKLAAALEILRGWAADKGLRTARQRGRLRGGDA